MNRVNQIVWGILLLFGAFVIYESLQLSYYSADFGPGSGFFSFWLGVLVIGLGVIEIARTLGRAPEPLPDGFLPSREGIGRILCLLGALVAALFLMKPLGFSLTILAFCMFLFRALAHLSLWATVLISLLSSFGLFHLFRFLQVFLPTGFLGI